MEALGILATKLLEHLRLGLALHTLGNHRHPHVVGDMEHVTNDRGPLRLQLQELHVQLQHVNRQQRQHVQRRATAAEVVHLDPIAKAPQLAHQLDQPARLTRVCALRHFKIQVPRLQAVVFHDAVDRPDQVRHADVHPADIGGDRDTGTQALLPAPDLACDAIPDIVVQGADQPVPLEEGDESVRSKEAKAGMIPADQGLGTDESAVADPELGLVADDKLTLLNGTGSIPHQPHLLHLRLVQIGIEKAVRLVEVLTGAVAGEIGPLEGSRHGQLMPDGRIDTAPHLHLWQVAHLTERFQNLPEQLRPVFLMGDQDEEAVGLPSSDDAAHLRETDLDQAGQDTEHVVAYLRAIQVPEHAEMVDVEHQRIVAQSRVCLHQLFRIREEDFAGVDSGQVVMLAQAQQAVLATLADRPLDLQPDQPRVRGKHNEILGPLGQGVKFVLAPFREGDQDTIARTPLHRGKQGALDQQCIDIPSWTLKDRSRFIYRAGE